MKNHTPIDGWQFQSVVINNEFEDTKSSWAFGLPDVDIKRLDKKEQLIHFYQEDLQRRKHDNLKYKKQKMKQYQISVNNLKYLLALQQERQRNAQQKLILMSKNTINRMPSTDDKQFSLRISMDSDILDLYD